MEVAKIQLEHALAVTAKELLQLQQRKHVQQAITIITLVLQKMANIQLPVVLQHLVVRTVLLRQLVLRVNSVLLVQKMIACRHRLVSLVPLVTLVQLMI